MPVEILLWGKKHRCFGSSLAAVWWGPRTSIFEGPYDLAAGESDFTFFAFRTFRKFYCLLFAARGWLDPLHY
jgi:hypothetical protein